MARTPSFDRDTVVRAARTAFWSTGYDSASIPELEAATGLSRSSIYNAFGSKRGLFDAAVQNYLDEVVRPRLQPLIVDPVAPDALTEYLGGLSAGFARVESMAGANGCLLINTAASDIVHDSDVARIIADYRAELRAAFRRGVAARLPESAPAEHDAIADTVTGLVVAAFALVRADRDNALSLLDTARAAVAARG